jgi:hypothetical protein
MARPVNYFLKHPTLDGRQMTTPCHTAGCIIRKLPDMSMQLHFFPVAGDHRHLVNLSAGKGGDSRKKYDRTASIRQWKEP